MNIYERERWKKWEDLRRSRERCENCMKDAPSEACCKMHCGEYTMCETCILACREGKKLCRKDNEE